VMSRDANVSPIIIPRYFPLSPTSIFRAMRYTVIPLFPLFYPGGISGLVMHLIEHNSLEVNGDIGNANIIEKNTLFYSGEQKFFCWWGAFKHSLGGPFSALHGRRDTAHKKGRESLIAGHV